MDFIISRRLSSGRYYAYYKNRFWFWDDTRNVWTESHLMSQKYEREHAARATLTPEDFMSDLTKFLPLDEYELDSVMADALKTAKPCKTVPIEPVEREVASVPAVSTPADIAEPFGNTPAVPSFDFSALGDLSDQATEADQQFDLHYGAAQDEYLISCIYLAKIHALTAKAGRYGGGTWTKWYESKGLGEGSVRRMIQNGEAFKSANMAELKQLPELTRKDLNLIARSGCAEQLTEAAGDSQRVQELLAQLKAEQARADRAVAEIGDKEKTIKSLLDRSEAADARAGEAESHYKAALADVTGLQEQYSQMSQRANNAEARAKEAEAALKKQPITAVVDEEEVDRRAHQQAYAIAADMTEELKTDRDRLQENNAALQKQLAEAQAVPLTDLQDDIETADGCCINMEGLWSMARPAFTRLIGTGEDLNHAAESMISLCDRIRAEAVQFIIKNDKETQYE